MWALDLSKRFLLEEPRVNLTKPALWVHCASVGEFNTVRPLLEELRKDFSVVLTYFSPRAKDYLEKRKDMVDFLFPLPADLPFLVKRFERAIKPKALLVVERELWISLIKATYCKKILLNAYAKGSFLERLLVEEYDLILARTHEDKRVFESLGARRVEVCGNLKLVGWEGPPPPVNLPKGFKYLVAGSTHRGEEEIILDAFEFLKREKEDLRLVIAPRHISRAEEVRNLVRKRDMKVSLRTEEGEDWEVLVVNTLGELRGFYCEGDIAFVGGTFVPVGGHNLLEPAFCSKPVLFGPHTRKVEDIKEILLRFGYGFPVGSPWELYRTAKDLLEKGFKPLGDLKELSLKVKDCYLRSLRGEL